MAVEWQPRELPLIAGNTSFVLDRWRPSDGAALRRFDIDPDTARFFGWTGRAGASNARRPLRRCPTGERESPGVARGEAVVVVASLRQHIPRVSGLRLIAAGRMDRVRRASAGRARPAPRTPGHHRSLDSERSARDRSARRLAALPARGQASGRGTRPAARSHSIRCSRSSRRPRWVSANRAPGPQG